MRAVLQRVTEASVTVEDEVVGRIGPGLLVLLGVAGDDTDADAVYIADKIADIRLFDGEPEKSLSETGRAALVVSQFTLMGDCRKGRRPSWSLAARPDEANRLYEAVVGRLRARGIPTETGAFRAYMAVRLTNDGPFTVLLDSRKTF
jgi:D-tyrosyl-tRNA(Tyr) deacylase